MAYTGKTERKNITIKGGIKNCQNATKWTEEKALQLGYELIEWLCDKDQNNKVLSLFLLKEKGLYLETLHYLKKKFPSFLKLYQTAKEIQKGKIVDLALDGKINGRFAQFTLMVNHNMIPAKHPEKEDKPQDFAENNRLRFEEKKRRILEQRQRLLENAEKEEDDYVAYDYEADEARLEEEERQRTVNAEYEVIEEEKPKPVPAKANNGKNKKRKPF